MIIIHHRAVCKKPEKGAVLVQATSWKEEVEAGDTGTERDPKPHEDNKSVYTKAPIYLVCTLLSNKSNTVYYCTVMYLKCQTCQTGMTVYVYLLQAHEKDHLERSRSMP